MNIVFCLNVFKNDYSLKNNIEYINRYFSSPPIFIASNFLEKPHWLTSNVTFRKVAHHPDPTKFEDWQSGALNTSLASIKLAEEHIKDPENWNFIFCHDDLLPVNPQKILSLLEELKEYDLICRKFEKEKRAEYIMIECFLFSGRILKFLSSIPTPQQIDNCAEITFGFLISGIKKKVIPFWHNVCNKENEMGFYHDHPRGYMEKEKSSLTILTHTHSDCKDIWKPYFDSINKYFLDSFSEKVEHFVVTNSPISDEKGIREFYYSDNQKFSDRLKEALSNIRTEFVLFMLEDYISYDYVKLESIYKFLKCMERDKRITFIRLLQSGASFASDYNEDLYLIDPNETYFFSTQGTIWRRDMLEVLVNNCQIARVQSEPETSPFLRKIATMGLCVKERGERVGGHFDSKVFPYIATASVGGKWNISEYPRLLNILNEYRIDPNLRGCR